jgi:hypothetical protein
VTWCGSMATSIGGETTSGRGNGGDNTSWADANLIGSKNKENPHGQLNCFKWMTKI